MPDDSAGFLWSVSRRYEDIIEGMIGKNWGCQLSTKFIDPVHRVDCAKNHLRRKPLVFWFFALPRCHINDQVLRVIKDDPSRSSAVGFILEYERSLI